MIWWCFYGMVMSSKLAIPQNLSVFCVLMISHFPVLHAVMYVKLNFCYRPPADSSMIHLQSQSNHTSENSSQTHHFIMNWNGESALQLNTKGFEYRPSTIQRPHDVITMKQFLHYRPFVRGIHWSLVDSPHHQPVMWSLHGFFVVTWKELLNKQLGWPWFEMPWWSYHVTVMKSWHENCSTSNGSWCMGIKGEMSGTVCVTFTWYMYIYIWVVYSFCLFCCLFIIVTTQFVALYKPCKPKPKFR